MKKLKQNYGNFQQSNEFSIIHNRKFIVRESIKGKST